MRFKKRRSDIAKKMGKYSTRHFVFLILFDIVFGMYNYSGNDMHDEMDVEIARWCNSAWDNLNYTIWPEPGVTASPACIPRPLPRTMARTRHIALKEQAPVLNFKVYMVS